MIDMLNLLSLFLVLTILHMLRCCYTNVNENVDTSNEVIIKKSQELACIIIQRAYREYKKKS